MAVDRLHAAEIDDEQTEAELAAIALGDGRVGPAAQERLDARDELVVVEGLAHVVVRADAQADDAIRRIALRGDEEDRHVRLLAELEAQADAVDAGHHHVEAYEVGAEAVEDLEGLA